MAFADGSEPVPPVAPEEALAVQNAIASRQREFALGRWCARRALAELGAPVSVIPVAPNRAPCWPDNVVGSITHCRGFVGAVVASAHDLRAIGFDAERIDPLETDLIPSVCTASEIGWVLAQPPAAGVDWPKIIFSAKEAVHKCVSPMTGRMLDFLDVTLEIDPVVMGFRATPATPDSGTGIDLAGISGRVATTDRFIFTCAFVSP